MSAPFCSHGWTPGDCPYCKVQELQLQNSEMRKLLNECEGWLSHQYTCPESPDVFSENLAKFAAKISPFIEKVVGAPMTAQKMTAQEIGTPLKPKCEPQTIEDLLGECRECNRLVRDCGNHGPVTEKRKCKACGGEGRWVQQVEDGTEEGHGEEVHCQVCHGTGDE